MLDPQLLVSAAMAEPQQQRAAMEAQRQPVLHVWFRRKCMHLGLTQFLQPCATRLAGQSPPRSRSAHTLSQLEGSRSTYSTMWHKRAWWQVQRCGGT